MARGHAMNSRIMSNRQACTTVFRLVLLEAKSETAPERISFSEPEHMILYFQPTPGTALTHMCVCIVFAFLAVPCFWLGSYFDDPYDTTFFDQLEGNRHSFNLHMCFFFVLKKGSITGMIFSVVLTYFEMDAFRGSPVGCQCS